MADTNWNSLHHQHGVADVTGRGDRRPRVGGTFFIDGVRDTIVGGRCTSPFERAWKFLRSGAVTSSVLSAPASARRRPIVSGAPLQRPARLRPSPRRGGAERTPARCSRSHDANCQGDQSHARPTREGVGRPVSFARAEDTARGPSRARLRPTELAEASAWRPWARSALVGRVVHGVADLDGGATGTLSGG